MKKKNVTNRRTDGRKKQLALDNNMPELSLQSAGIIKQCIYEIISHEVTCLHILETDFY